MDDVELPIIVGLLGAAIVIPAVAAVLWRQYRHWRAAETAREAAEKDRERYAAALDTAPEGYIAWFPAGANPERETCSRRLAVLLDLLRGRDATFADVLEGFEPAAQEQLRQAVARLREAGEGFRLALAHAASGRRIEARGLRAVADDGEALADIVWMTDVTEGVAAVDALTLESTGLKREAVLLKLALDGIETPVWVRDDDLSLIYCNRAYVAAVDGKDAADVLARGRELAPRMSVREARALAAAARASAETRKAAFHMVLDGSRRLMEVTETPVSWAATAPATDSPSGKADAPLFSDGTGRLTAGIANDITRQEELETRLKREAAAHADVLERLGTAIAVFGPDTRLAFHNAAYAKLWGLDPAWLAEAPGYAAVLDNLRTQRRLPEVADFPAYKEKELARFNSLLEPLEDVLHLPDGGTLRRVVAPHPMGGLLTTYEDVTDKLALERSYNTLIAVQRETIDNLQEAVAVFGADGRLRLANPSFCAMWNLNAEALNESPALGAVVDAFKALFDDETVFARHRATLVGALDPDRKRETQQGRVVPSAGAVLEFVAVPLPDGGVLFCYNDVSAPERAAQTLRTRAEGLAASEHAKTDIAARVLAALQRELKKPGANAVAEIIADAQELMAFNVANTSLRLDAVDMAATVQHMVRLALPSKPGAEIAISGAETVGWIVGDATRIKMAVLLALAAALDCSDTGAVRLALTRDTVGAEVSLRASLKGRAASEVTRARIALEFCRRVLSACDGTLVESDDGETTTFAVTLPSGDGTGSRYKRARAQ
ncbi:MAG: PAS-domain containing protein [Rhodospirillaceae bacterium]|nr:PAS-domain containing protein [Rhodospirillaceae bacterium]